MTAAERALSQTMLDALIRAGLVVALVVFCYQIFHPFLDLMLWSVILAVTMYPAHVKLRSRMGGRDGRAATILVLVAIVVLLVPLSLLGKSLLESAHDGVAALRAGDVQVPPPSEAVKDWPLVGKPLYGYWLQASTDLSGLAQKFAPEIKAFGLSALGKMAGVALGLVLFFAALAIAGIMMAFGELGYRSAVAICGRLFGPDRSEKTAALCTSTIRAVAQGVVGIAFIQAILVGLGLAVYGVPAFGVLSLVVVMFGILQLPVLLITLPVIAWVLHGDGATAGSITFSVYLFIAGLADNVLKPLLLGRGVDVPMPVVLIGALGGMVTGGILGLFIGPVMLAVAYQLFWQWVEDQQPAQGATASEVPGVDTAAAAIPPQAG
jgi:predicted PurR-regulated permease PerM